MGLKIKEKIPVKGLRERIAKKMSQAWNLCPVVPEILLIDMNGARDLAKELRPSNVNLNDLIVKATALSLKENPLLNSALPDKEIFIFEDINIAFAVALDDGLITPVIHQADRLSLEALAQKRLELAGKVKNGARTPDVLTGGTFTITNLGGFGLDFFTPILNYPQCAVLGIGGVKERPVVKEGNIVPSFTAYITLVFDHRIIDGAPAAIFLNRIKEMLESPESLR